MQGYQRTAVQDNRTKFLQAAALSLHPILIETRLNNKLLPMYTKMYL